MNDEHNYSYAPPDERRISNFRYFGWVEEMRQRIAELEFEIEEFNEQKGQRG